MQISDLLGQYNNMSQSAPLKGTGGVRQLVSSLREMSAGNIFEGTVTYIKGGQVTLALSNGQQVTARLEGKVPMMVGQSLFFQVKSNDGTQIAIRPYMVDGNNANLTLMDALSAAGLPVDGRNLSMVNAMMEENMSIDRNSLIQMARIAGSNPDIDVKTLVQMHKLDIPITPEMAAQFQNYADDRQAITREMSAFIDELPMVFAGGERTDGKQAAFAGQLLSVVTEGLPEEVFIPKDIRQMLAKAQETEPQMLKQAETQAAGDAAEAVPFEKTAEGQRLLSSVPNTLGNVLSSEQIDTLSQQLDTLRGMHTEEEGMPKLTLSPLDSTVSVLNAIQEHFSASGAIDGKLIRELFAGAPMQALLRDALEQQWMVRPKELDRGDKVRELYERLDDQLSRIQELVKTSGQDGRHVTQLAMDIRSNIEFMNQINQLYTYVQIPLKMAGQNTSGELFVYTNRKNPAQDREELTAFLHLDMEHLGSTDVSVKLRGREVFTKFYFEDEKTYDLVEAHIPELEKRLLAKGYHSTITVANEGKSVNFVEDFLKQDQPSAGMVHRYSFDMRA